MPVSVPLLHTKIDKNQSNVDFVGEVENKAGKKLRGLELLLTTASAVLGTWALLVYQLSYNISETMFWHTYLGCMEMLRK